MNAPPKIKKIGYVVYKPVCYAPVVCKLKATRITKRHMKQLRRFRELHFAALQKAWFEFFVDSPAVSVILARQTDQRLRTWKVAS